MLKHVLEFDFFFRFSQIHKYFFFFCAFLFCCLVFRSIKNAVCGFVFFFFHSTVRNIYTIRTHAHAHIQNSHFMQNTQSQTVKSYYIYMDIERRKENNLAKVKSWNASKVASRVYVNLC